ncbi:NAD(P)H-dependent flavin oxidoreductase [Nocardia terpenica]|uniref:2-nitropropane dioxygenase n=1 Tax=Nocardia terpenica TaxID=455432 RepID=A0A164MI76_9NOCA|nr:nitronate monooxygenase [Nocardia terpenica]KZM73381.1 2-nitropropane dioxygenase [Nocardia terpenica]NQE87454.1 nitronate monooxygenase [Nocardia terpenica]
MSLRTRFCDLVGIELPVVQAPIGGPCVPALAAAVSNAGGLGMLAVSWDDPQRLAERVASTAAATGKPFGVNVILHWPQQERVAHCLAAGVRIVSTFWGDPAPYTAMIHDAGAVHLHTVASAAEARAAVAAGVDVIVAQGREAGGHVWGEVGTLPLVPAVVDAVAPVPVVAAGGIADGRGLAAVLALGAEAAWIGTRFLLAEEAATADAYRRAVAAAAETDTVHGIIFDKGWPDAPHRALRNSTIRAWEAAGRPAPGQRPGEDDVVGTWLDGQSVPRYADRAPLIGATGDTEAMALYAGQSAGSVHRTQPAADIVAEIAAEAEGVFAARSRS